MSDKRRPTGFIRTKKTKTKGTRYYAFVVAEGREVGLGAFGSRDNAIRKLREAERQIERGTFGRGEPTLNEFYEEWIRAKAQTLKPGTVDDYRATFRLYVLPELGDVKLTKISPAQVQSWIDNLSVKGLGAATVNKAFRYFRNITNNALAKDVIDRSPCRGVIVPRPSREVELDILTVAEVRQVLDVAEEPERTMVAVLAFAGLRIGEVLGLKWKDIDFDQRCIRVERTWTRHGTWSTPKSRTSRRAVSMAVTLQALLSHYFEASGLPGPELVLFSHDGVRPLDHSNFRRDFNNALETAGIRHVRVHDLRHTYATVLLSHGASIKWLQMQLGHSTASQTLDVYSHFIPESGAAALAGFDAVIDGSVTRLPAPREAYKKRK